MGLDASGIGAAATAVGSVVNGIMERLFPTPTERASADAMRTRATIEEMMAPLQGQIDINKVEAASPSLFVSGWRPAVGWLGAAAVGWNYVVAPLLVFVLQACGVRNPPPPPVLDDTMAQLLFGLLGLNIGARTVERVRGVAREQPAAEKADPVPFGVGQAARR